MFLSFKSHASSPYLNFVKLRPYPLLSLMGVVLSFFLLRLVWIFPVVGPVFILLAFRSHITFPAFVTIHYFAVKFYPIVFHYVIVIHIITIFSESFVVDIFVFSES